MKGYRFGVSVRRGDRPVHKIHLAAIPADGIQRFLYKIRANGGFGIEGEDQPSKPIAAGLIEDGKSYLLSQLNKRGGSELECGKQKVHHEMIEEQLVVGAL